MNHHSFFLKLLASTVLTLGVNILWQASAIASGNLSITPITWDIIGLDSNKVTDGPDTFMVGSRVCNTGADPATNVVVKFNRIGTTNPYINLQYSNTLSIASLPAGASTAAQTRPPNSYGSTPSNCSDFYYNLVITRNAAAYNTTQQYYIEASADNAALVRTPTNRQLYVEKLVSQNRNAVATITGPTTVMVGQTYQYTVTGSTATGGYEQLVFSPNFPNVIFQVVGVSATYTAPGGANNNSIYADACGWTNDFTSSFYHNNLECTDATIPDGYAGGKAGNNVSTVYTVKILSAGSATITNLIYDFSGSSYHYNSDFGAGINTYTITAVNAPDLTIAKSHTGNFTQGTTNTYNLNVSNVAAVGSGATSGAVTVTDTLPTGLTPTAASGTGWSCAIAGQTITCTRSGALNPGASYPSISLTVAIAANAPSSLTNTASVAGGSEVNTANNSASDPTTINPAPDLTISKTHTGNFSQGQTGATYTLTAQNNGSASTTGAVTLTDTVPTGLTPTAAAGTGWNCSITGQTITCTRSDALAASASYSPVTVMVNVASNAPTSLTNVASIAGGGEVNTTNNSASDPTAISSLPDLTITKTHTGTFTQGTTGAYTLTITNNGTIASSGTVTVSDTVPTGLTPTAASGTGWACSITGQSITCTRADGLAASASYPAITLSVSVAANAPTSITNIATVSGGNDGNTGNNSSSDPTTIAIATDLSITKTDGQTSTTPGSAIAYTITVTNNGPSTVNSVTVNDTLPASIQTPVFTPSTGSYNSSTGAWTSLTLASGQSITLTVSGTVSTSATGTLTNTATVALPSGVTDTNSANNSATDTTTIAVATDLSITKTDGQTSTTPGSAIAYTITVTNNGPSTVNSVTVNDTLPAAIQSPVFTPSTGSYNSGTGAWTGLTLAPGQSLTLTVNGTVSTSATGTLTNMATVAPPSGVTDSTPGNNSATDTTTITPTADLRLAKTVSIPVPAVGATITYTVTVTNAGPSSATNVAVDDLLPAGVTFSSATPSQGTYNNSTGLWTVGAIANGSSATLQIAVVVNTSAIVTNTAEVSASDQFDPNSTPGNHNSSENDQASVSIPFAPPRLQLVKRITAINGVTLANRLDDPSSTADNAPNWPLPLDGTSGISTYLKGLINGGTIRSGDILEYTIYFLSDGGAAATNINLCDLVPTNSTFIPDSFSSVPESGINLTIGATSTNLTNVPDTDSGQFFNPGGTPSVSCSATNTNGAVVVNVVKSPANLPNATAPGTPTNSYGFIRFRARVN